MLLYTGIIWPCASGARLIAGRTSPKRLFFILTESLASVLPGHPSSRDPVLYEEGGSGKKSDTISQVREWRFFFFFARFVELYFLSPVTQNN